MEPVIDVQARKRELELEIRRARAELCYKFVNRFEVKGRIRGLDEEMSVIRSSGSDARCSFVPIRPCVSPLPYNIHPP
jgi:hypothetical protein